MTTENKHTPGPWVREAQNIYADDGLKIVASTKPHVHGMDWPTAEANARLIASAPDLLAALERLSTFEAFTVHGWGDINPEVTARVEYARAAIAKARGQ